MTANESLSKRSPYTTSDFGLTIQLPGTHTLIASNPLIIVCALSAYGRIKHQGGNELSII